MLVPMAYLVFRDVQGITYDVLTFSVNNFHVSSINFDFNLRLVVLNTKTVKRDSTRYNNNYYT